jgi:putative N-acetylmannosamine-6-phosphate epimerase
MMASRGMGAIRPSKMPGAKTKARRDDTDFTQYKEGGKVKSKVNAAGNYTKPELRKRIFNSVKAAAIVGTGAGQWSARKAQVMAKRYKAAGGGYRD